MVSIHINGKEISAAQGATILQACNQVGVDIPTFCYDARLKAEGSCRICVVEVEGAPNLVPACAHTITPGMKVQTHSQKVMRMRRRLLELYLSDHEVRCLTCEKSGSCRLQDYSFEYGVNMHKFAGPKSKTGHISAGKFFYLDQSKCVLCRKCTRVCNELQANKVWATAGRGFETAINTPFEINMEDSGCVSCGNCVSACPVGALMPKKSERFRDWEVQKTRTTCAYCGVGCQMHLLTKGEKVVGAEPVLDALNNGMLCVKGKFGYHFINDKARLKTPLIRKNGKLEEASWEEAYDLIHEKMTAIKEAHGPDSFALLGSSKVTVEENYLFQKFARGVIGTNNIDCSARL